jgi:hypothetical protein
MRIQLTINNNKPNTAMPIINGQYKADGSDAKTDEGKAKLIISINFFTMLLTLQRASLPCIVLILKYFT